MIEPSTTRRRKVIIGASIRADVPLAGVDEVTVCYQVRLDGFTIGGWLRGRHVMVRFDPDMTRAELAGAALEAIMAAERYDRDADEIVVLPPDDGDAPLPGDEVLHDGIR